MEEINKHSGRKMPTIHQGRNGELPLEKALGMKYAEREMKLTYSQRLGRKQPDIPPSPQAA